MDLRERDVLLDTVGDTPLGDTTFERPFPLRIEGVFMLLKHMLKNDVRFEVIFEFEHALDFGPELIEVGDASGISSGSFCRDGRGAEILGVFASGFTIHVAFLCATRDGVV